MQPQVSWQQPCQGGDHGTLSPVRFRACHLSAQDRNLMAQHQVSRRRESHPPPLAEPCGSLSAHTAPIVQPSGLTPNRQ